MAKRKTAIAINDTDSNADKAQLQRQMARTRESLAETVGEIRETVQQEVGMVKRKVADILDYREEFAKDPIVWSLGALSAGFALGYTVGYAHKNSKRGKQTPVLAFADSMVDEISNVGQALIVPTLDSKIKELFGFRFSDMLEQIGGPKRSSKRSSKKKTTSRKSSKTSNKKPASRKRPASQKKK